LITPRTQRGAAGTRVSVEASSPRISRTRKIGTPYSSPAMKNVK
jgi:hypothetical protein